MARIKILGLSLEEVIVLFLSLSVFHSLFPYNPSQGCVSEGTYVMFCYLGGDIRGNIIFEKIEFYLKAIF
jgi:hypothetical protein